MPYRPSSRPPLKARDSTRSGSTSPGPSGADRPPIEDLELLAKWGPQLFGRGYDPSLYLPGRDVWKAAQGRSDRLDGDCRHEVRRALRALRHLQGLPPEHARVLAYVYVLTGKAARPGCYLELGLQTLPEHKRAKARQDRERRRELQIKGFQRLTEALKAWG